MIWPDVEATLVNEILVVEFFLNVQNLLKAMIEISEENTESVAITNTFRVPSLRHPITLYQKVRK